MLQLQKRYQTFKNHYLTGVFGRLVVVTTSCFVSSAVPVTQQDPSLGQNASLSTSSQNSANKPLTHSPSHDL